MNMSERRCPYCRGVLSVRLSDNILVCPRCGASYVAYKGERGCPLGEIRGPAALPVCGEVRLYTGRFRKDLIPRAIEEARERARFELLKAIEPQISYETVEEKTPEPHLLIRASARIVDKDFIFR